MILVIDNYDSFTYNLVDYLKKLHQDVKVIRNDSSISIITNNISSIKGVVISPGPGTPSFSNNLIQMISLIIDAQLPILGICLGHQAIAQHFGMELYESEKPMHGKQDQIFHSGSSSLFYNIPTSFKAVRYNSLLIRNEKNFLIEIIATNHQNEVMAIQHKTLHIFGVQFHPESISTEYGLKILENWLSILNRLEI